MLRKNISAKKGIMGIETLIIFIAMIIVAAIAAGVLLRTQGILQQRALAVGNEARERVVTGLEVVSLIADIDTVNAIIKSVEMTVRLRAGSSDVQLKVLGLTFNTKEYSNQMALSNRDMTSYRIDDIEFINATNRTTTTNYDNDPQDDDADKIRLVVGAASTIDNLSSLEVYLSSSEHFIFPLGINFSSTGQNISLSEVPLRYNYTTNNSPIYGYITVVGTTDGNTALIGTDNANWTSFYIESDINNCDVDTVTPDFKFCYTPRLGNTNTILEGGEIMNLRFKMSDTKLVGPGEQVELQVIPKDGTIETLTIVVPQVFSKKITTLWP